MTEDLAPTKTNLRAWSFDVIKLINLTHSLHKQKPLPLLAASVLGLNSFESVTLDKPLLQKAQFAITIVPDIKIVRKDYRI